MGETNEVEVCNLASELKSFIQIVDQEIKEARNILNEYDRPQDRSSRVSQMEKLQKDQELVKSKIANFLRKSFSSSLLSSSDVLEFSLPENEQFNSLKMKIELHKKAEEDLNKRLKIFLSKFGLPKSKVINTNLEESKKTTKCKNNSFPTDASSTSRTTTSVEKSRESNSSSGRADNPIDHNVNRAESRQSTGTDLSEGEILQDQSTDITSGTTNDRPVYDDLSDKGFGHTDGSSTYSDGGYYSKLLSKKLKLIHYCYLSSNYEDEESSSSLSAGSEFQPKYGWLRTNGCDDQLGEEGNYIEREFRVKGEAELTEKIRRLLITRRNEMAEARRQGKRNFLESISIVLGGQRIQNRASSIGISLSRYFGEFLLVISESWRNYDRFTTLKYILKLLMDKGKSKVIKKIVAVIEVAERELMHIGKFEIKNETSEVNFDQRVGDDDDDRRGNNRETKIDQIINMFLREALCLESILSYPTLSPDFNNEVPDLLNALDECDKSVRKIELEVAFLKAVHKFIVQWPNEVSMMEKYHRKMGIVIDLRWEQLDELEDDMINLYLQATSL